MGVLITEQPRSLPSLVDNTTPSSVIWYFYQTLLETDRGFKRWRLRP
jgi:hypothetical protein